jgi:hypothetical protein
MRIRSANLTTRSSDALLKCHRPDLIHRPGDGTLLRAAGVSNRPNLQSPSFSALADGRCSFVGEETCPVSQHAVQDHGEFAGERNLGIRDEAKGPLFRSATGKTGVLTATPMNRVDAYRMIRRRAAEAGFKQKLGCHVFRVRDHRPPRSRRPLENAQAMAAHESRRTTKLYDRTSDAISLDEIERITI